MKRLAITLAATLALTAIGASAETQRKDVDIKAPDSANLKGTFSSPAMQALRCSCSTNATRIATRGTAWRTISSAQGSTY